VSTRQRLTLLFVLLVVPGCAYNLSMQPTTVHNDGQVSGTAPSGYPASLKITPGQKVKLQLQQSSLCGAENSNAICMLEGKLLRLEPSADSGVTGLVVKPTSLSVEDVFDGSGNRPPRKKLPVPAGEVRLAISDIKAIFYKYWYVPGT
jgi:hypothetical protein